MNDLTEIKVRVKEAIDIADYIRGAGVALTGGPVEWKGLCPFHQEKTPSFTVNTEKRLFKCFGSCGASGDVFEFVQRTKGTDFMGALKMLANQAGIAIPENRIYQPREVQEVKQPQRGPFDADKYRPLVPGEKVHVYLTGKRKLNADVLAQYSVGQTTDQQAYSFAYKWWPPGVLRKEGAKPRFEFCKVVKVDRVDGKKIEFCDPKGGKRILFGMLAVPDEAAELVICEGEIDAITWAQYGFPAVSVPGGAGFAGWIDVCWEWLERFNKIHISFDEDSAGRKKLVEVVQRLGMARTDIIRLPEKEPGTRFKDANECLQAGVTAEAMAECVRNPEILRPKELKCIGDFEDDIWRKFHPEGKDQLGLLLPWGNSNRSSLPFRFRPGEVTVWTGFNKHGKSEVLNHVVIDLCWQGERALICSLEVAAPETYRKVIRMALGRRDVIAKEERQHFYDRCLKPLADLVWVYDHVGSAPIEDVRNVMLYAFQRYGCRQFVLDSLMRFDGLDGEDQGQWNKQRDFMNVLVEFAARYGVHVHLVAHSRKPDKSGEGKIPRRYDIAGSGYISNLAHNVIVVWRNRAKQDRLETMFQSFEDAFSLKFPNEDMPQWKRLSGGPPAADAPEGIRRAWGRMMDFMNQDIDPALRDEFLAKVQEHDSYFIVDAQRGGDGDCPARHLWFHYDSLQFIEASGWAPLRASDPRNKPFVYAGRTVDEMDEAF